MGSMTVSLTLPNVESQDIQLSHPTAEECVEIWKLSFLAWGDALSLPLYLEESAFLTTVPLAKDGGMTLWILTDKTLSPNKRPILCSCETFRKRSLVGDTKGDVTEMIVHGVASVFCNPLYRGRGYASRLMKELAKVLPTWQTERRKCIGSVLYSDIGKSYYAELGWHPFPNNNHVEFDPMIASKSPKATIIRAGDLDQLCKEDEAMVWKAMSSSISDRRMRMVLVPDLDHMLWHHRKEEFVCDRLFGKQPQAKGAIAGQLGNRIWAIWTHRFYGDPESTSSDNTLYILRLVIENQASDAAQIELQAEQLRAVLQIAQAEAAEWKLRSVKLWDPSALAQNLIERTGIPYRRVKREHESIASLLWYGEGSVKENVLEWVGNEKYAWC